MDAHLEVQDSTDERLPVVEEVEHEDSHAQPEPQQWVVLINSH